MSVLIEISYGELIDKITILEIKAVRVTDPLQLENIHYELQLLTAARESQIQTSATVDELTRQLRTINEILWDVEDRIRDKEQNLLFDTEFIELARSVYQTNDRRAELKRKLNDHLGSRIVEVKIYQPYLAKLPR